MEITKNSKNIEISEVFAKELDTKNPIVFYVSDPVKGGDEEMYQQLFLAQKIESKVSVENELFLGWKPLSFITRCTRNIKVSEIEANPFLKGIAKQGAVLAPITNGENEIVFNIQYEDLLEPAYPDQSPVLSNDRETGEEMLVVNKETGLPIYRTTSLVIGKANNKPFKNIEKISNVKKPVFNTILGKSETVEA